MNSNNMLNHIGVIPDGNRRCAKRLLKRPWKGHDWGLKKVRNVFEWGKGLDIKVFTFYSLSLENMEKRPSREINYLFKLAEKEADDMINNKNSFVHINKIHVTFFGNLDKLPTSLRDKIKTVMDITSKYNDYVINFAVAYGGRQEIINACQEITADVLKGKTRPEQIDEAMISQHLQTNGYGDPDLIVRTGGEKRLSNFLLFQSAYSELAFVDTLWPDLNKREFEGMVKDYLKRERRFGG